MRAIVSILLLAMTALMCSAQPTISEGGIGNAASGVPVAAPGGLVSLFGSDLAATLAQGDSIPLSTTIADVSVTINGTPAPLMFVAPGQINAQIPWDTAAGGNASVVVRRGGAASAPATVQIASSAPGFFMVPGGTQVIAINADGTIAAAAGAISGLTTHGARTGDVLIVYATGLGAVTPAVQSGHNSMDQLRRAVGTPTVLIGGIPVSIDFAGLAPQFPGVNQLNIVVPAGVPAGPNVPIEIQMGGRSHQATIAITQ